MPGRNFKILLLGLCLSACAKQAAEQGIKVEYVDRPVIQMKPCVTKDQVPSRPAPLGLPPDNIEVALSTALAKISEWGRYGNKADIIMKGCSQ